jgi:hypothetical protein
MEPDRRGDTEHSPGYGISPPFGGMGLPRGKQGESLIGTLWENGMSLYAAHAVWAPEET